MRYIDAIAGGFLALLLLGLMSYFWSPYGNDADFEIVFTVSSFLFAILAGFIIARLNDRYNSVRDLIASEDAQWLSMYKTAGLYGKEFQKQVAELMDQYYIAMFDLANITQENYKVSLPIFLKLHDHLATLKKYRGEGTFQNLLNHLSSIEECRNRISVLTAQLLTAGQWVVLIVLSIVLIFSLFRLQDGDLGSQLVTVLLASVVVLVLLLVRDLQNLRLGGQLLAIESGEEIFDLIDRPRYYNHKYLEDGSIKIPSQLFIYRVGLHKPGEKQKIKMIKIALANRPSIK